VSDQTTASARFAAIVYDDRVKQFVFSARKWDEDTFSYICQQNRRMAVMATFLFRNYHYVHITIVSVRSQMPNTVGCFDTYYL